MVRYKLVEKHFSYMKTKDGGLEKLGVIALYLEV